LPNVIYSGDGTLRFLSLSTLDEGYYQCLAFNDYGVAMSTVAVLRRALITASAPLMTRQHNESEGRQFMLRCQPSKSFPSPYYSWYVGPESKPVKQDRRIQFDDSGKICQSSMSNRQVLLHKMVTVIDGPEHRMAGARGGCELSGHRFDVV
jgi:hypothetical protein